MRCGVIVWYRIMGWKGCVKKLKWSRYRPGVAQRVGSGIALLFHDHGTRRGWMVSSTPRPHFTPGKDPVPILQEAGWAPGPVWTGGKSRLHRNSIADRPARRCTGWATRPMEKLCKEAVKSKVEHRNGVWGSWGIAPPFLILGNIWR